MSITDEQLLDYLDGNLNDSESALIDKAVQEDIQLQTRLEQLKFVDSSLASMPAEHPSSNFVSQVMNSVFRGSEEPESFFNRSRYFVLGLIGLALIGTLYFFAIKFYPDLSGIVADEVTIQDKTVDLSPANQILNTDLIFKLVFYVNGIVGLLLFERAILKPYFMRRKQRFSM